MIQGSVRGLQASLPVVFRQPNQPDLSIEFVIDTGFAGELTLPPAAVAALRLPFIEMMTANLADDSVASVTVHAATIVWDGVEREAAVLAMGRRPLLGTALLDGFNLSADFADGGSVTIQRL